MTVVYYIPHKLNCCYWAQNLPVVEVRTEGELVLRVGSCAAQLTRRTYCKEWNNRET